MKKNNYLKELDWYAELLKQDVAYDCCCHFWANNSLQNILNIPIKYCSYCGTKLSKEQFKAILERQFPSHSKTKEK